ncbi:MAG: glutaredoxin family protein [Thermomicrobiales bacterium]
MPDTLPPIIMYARTRPCPDCTRSRGRLTDLGLPWTELNTEEDPAQMEAMVALTGRRSVPTIVIGESILVEPSNAELDAALTKAGYVLDPDSDQ